MRTKRTISDTPPIRDETGKGLSAGWLQPHQYSPTDNLLTTDARQNFYFPFDNIDKAQKKCRTYCFCYLAELLENEKH